jgi:zinc transport system substrate-binding protein
MKYILVIVATTLFFIGGWYGISSNQITTSESREISQSETAGLSVVTSFYPLQFALERIVGDLGTVTNVGAGKDPHDFEPTTQDMLSMQKADVVVLQGAEFEPWGDDVTARLESDGVPVILATTNIELHEGDHHEHEDAHGEEEAEHEEEDHEHGVHDPHTWLDPVLFSEMVAHMADEIATIDPDHAETYQANASALQTELAELDAEYKNRLTNCELDEVITSHEALGYLAERYNFHVHSIAGLSTQDTPSVTTLAELKEEAEEGIGAILLEENSVKAYGETLARETGLVSLSVNPIEYFIPNGEDYFTLMRSNLDTFATALRCNE